MNNIRRIGRKEEAINLIRLYSEWRAENWIRYLKKKRIQGDIRGLARHMYAMQAGMDDLTKQKLNSPKIIQWYARLIKSMDSTARWIYKDKNPSPLDNYNNRTMYSELHWITEKRQRDADLEVWMRKNFY